MSKKNCKELAAQILARVGGKEHVNRVYQTRLRFTLTDESKADKNALEALDGVWKVMISSGVYPVVIGTDAADLFAELEPPAESASGSDDAPAEKRASSIRSWTLFPASSCRSFPLSPALAC